MELKHTKTGRLYSIGDVIHYKRKPCIITDIKWNTYQRIYLQTMDERKYNFFLYKKDLNLDSMLYCSLTQ
jgi:hypothetical protein